MSSNINNVIGGHKATLARDNVSEETKEHSRQEIERLEGEVPSESTEANSHVIGGLKATLSNDRTSDEAKANAQHKLADLGVDSYGETGAPVANDVTIEEDVVKDDEFTNRQLGGFKAALKNPNVSEEAKEEAAEKLRAAGVQA